MLLFFARLTILAYCLWLATPTLADELPLTRWQILPLTELFYSASGTDHVVTAAFDLPCGATPLGAVLIDRGQKPAQKLQVAAMVTRPIVACARLPERRYFKMPFVDSTAYKVIEPLRGDLDGIRVVELNTTSLQPESIGSGIAPELKVEVPCGVMPVGMLVTPDLEGQHPHSKPKKPISPMRFQLAAIGFRLPPRQVMASCENSGRGNTTPGAIRTGGLANAGHYRVMPRRVSDLRKLGVLQLRGIDRLDLNTRRVHFQHRCYEVPVGIAVVPRRGGQALAVAVASYINAPCLARQANIADAPLKVDSLPLEFAAGRSPGLDAKALRNSHVLTTMELKQFQFGQLLLAPGTRGDASGVVVATLKRGWFPFAVRSASNGGRFALHRTGINAEPSLDAKYASGSRPLRLQITSAL